VHDGRLELALEHLLHTLWVEHSLGIGETRSYKVLKSPVNDKSLSSDQTGSVAEEEDGGVGDFLNETQTSKGNVGLHGALRSGNGNAEAARAFGSVNGSRSDDVRANAPGPLLDGDHTREGVDTSLGGGDVSLVWKTYRNVVNALFPCAEELLTSVVKGGADMDIRTVRLTDVGTRGFEGVERSELVPNI
jgi:hypothetical protein